MASWRAMSSNWLPENRYDKQKVTMSSNVILFISTAGFFYCLISSFALIFNIQIGNSKARCKNHLREHVGCSIRRYKRSVSRVVQAPFPPAFHRFRIISRQNRLMLTCFSILFSSVKCPTIKIENLTSLQGSGE